MDLGVVAQPQLDRVHAQLVRQLVEQRLEREVALRLAGRPHHRDRRDVEPDPLVAGGDVRAGIRRGRADSQREVGVAGRGRQRLQRRLASRRRGSHRGGRGALVVDRDQLAVARGGDLEVLHGAGPLPDSGEHLRPGEAEPDRPFDGAGGQRGEDRVRPAAQPGAETAADVGRQHPHVLFGEPERRRQHGAHVEWVLGRVIDGQRAAVPVGDRGERAERVVRLRRRRERALHRHLGGLHGRRDVAALHVGQVRVRPGLGGCVLEGEHRLAAVVADLDQPCRRGGLLRRLGDDHRDVLAVMTDLRVL